MDELATWAWVRRENIARFRLALSGSLTVDQRRVIERLLAGELDAVAPAAPQPTDVGGQSGPDHDSAPVTLARSVRVDFL